MTATAFGFAELHGGDSRVRIIPALGGKIASLHIGGREWLWQGGALSGRNLADETDHGGTASPGGCQDCFPTGAACTVPSGVRRHGGTTLPDHGELWTHRPTVSLETRSDGQHATCVWLGKRMPYQFTREVHVTRTGDVRVRYVVENVGGDPLPFVWAAQAMLRLTDATKLDLPIGAAVRVAARTGSALHEMAPEFRWPHARLEKKIADFSHPDGVARSYACQLFLDLPASPTIVAVEEGADRLELHIDGREVPNFAVGLNKPERRSFRRSATDPLVSFGPSLGAPDSLADALGHWHGAQWLEPGAHRSWNFLWRGRRVTPSAPR